MNPLHRLAIVARMSLALLPLFAPPSATADDWSTDDKTRFAAVITSYLVDWHQTRQIAAEPTRYTERNPLLGRHPGARTVNTYFAIAGISTYYLADHLTPVWRTRLLVGILTLEASIIANNHHLGLKLTF